jgi:hypothetical protein
MFRVTVLHKTSRNVGIGDVRSENQTRDRQITNNSTATLGGAVVRAMTWPCFP